MSGMPDAEPVKSAVPVADLGVIDRALAEGGDALKAAVKQVRPADLGRDLTRRPIEEGQALLAASSDRRGTAMLLASHPVVASKLLAQTEAKRAATLVSAMPTDHRTAILGQLEAGERKRIEDALPEEQRRVLDRILSYPPSAVGRLMSPKVWRIDADRTAGDALRALEGDPGIEVASNCYVVERDVLVGVAALRELAVAPADKPVRELMVGSPIAVREDVDRGDAAEIIQVHDFLSLPVIDNDGRLVGAVRLDDLFDAAIAQIGVGQLNQGGIAGKVIGNVPYFQTSLVKNVRSRITWLILLFVAETATGTVLRYFDDELAKVVALTFFVPLLIGTGGNAGSQTVSTVIRALALGEARIGDWMRVLFKEASTGITVGILLGIIGFARSLLWGVGTEIASCVAITILVVCTWANTVGALIPIGAQRLKIDPTVVSAPLITTLVDATGLFIYLTIAGLLVSALHAAPKERVVYEAKTHGPLVSAAFGDARVGGELIAWPGGVAYVAYQTDAAGARSYDYGWGPIAAGDLTTGDGTARLVTTTAAQGGFVVEHCEVAGAAAPVCRPGSGAAIDVTWSAANGARLARDGKSRERLGKYTLELDGAREGEAAAATGTMLGHAIAGAGEIQHPADKATIAGRVVLEK